MRRPHRSRPTPIWGAATWPHWICLGARPMPGATGSSDKARTALYSTVHGALRVFGRKQAERRLSATQ